jgi:hypothetical protein
VQALFDVGGLAFFWATVLTGLHDAEPVRQKDFMLVCLTVCLLAWFLASIP